MQNQAASSRAREPGHKGTRGTLHRRGLKGSAQTTNVCLQSFFPRKARNPVFNSKSLPLCKCKKINAKKNRTKYYKTVRAKPNTPADQQPVPQKARAGDGFWGARPGASILPCFSLRGLPGLRVTQQHRPEGEARPSSQEIQLPPFEEGTRMETG